ncbi:MAG: helix-turn-helix domain-containing protein [Halobacteriales archaeon]|nr:helix-turn-helix domain-containing protein [Halobacteriales archaeon]
MDDATSVGDLLDTLGDERARDLLEAAAAEPQSAKQLAKRCGMSLPTVYRRLELLQEHALVTERTEVASDGNHYNVYESNFESTVITLDAEDGYDVSVYHRENAPSKFSQLWDELAGE